MSSTITNARHMIVIITKETTEVNQDLFPRPGICQNLLSPCFHIN